MAVKTITAKVTEARTEGGVAVITIELDDGKGKWQKVYKYANDAIKAQDLKERVAADVRKDLQVAGQLDEVNTLVGKTFTFTV